jgi:hypothetical protein
MGSFFFLVAGWSFKWGKYCFLSWKLSCTKRNTPHLLTLLLASCLWICLCRICLSGLFGEPGCLVFFFFLFLFCLFLSFFIYGWRGGAMRGKKDWRDTGDTGASVCIRGCLVGTGWGWFKFGRGLFGGH